MGIYRDNNFKQSNFEPALYLISTPIGNLSDISLRALSALENLDEVFCEDTSKTIKLLNHFGISRSLQKYHEYSDENLRNKIINLIKDGKSVGLVSDAGTPAISDPGYKLINAASKQGVKIYPIVGPTALVAALSISALPTDRFFFAGFCPRKISDKKGFLESFKNYKATIIFYETTTRIVKSLEIINEIFPEQEICLVREITKKYEEVIKGDAKMLLDIISKKDLKGELVLLVDNNKDRKVEGAVQLTIEEFVREFSDEMPPARLAAKLSHIFEMPKSTLYELILSFKR